MAGSLGDIPAMTGGPRVLIVPGGPGLLPAALQRAAKYAGGEGPAAQFLVAGTGFLICWVPAPGTV